MEETKRIKVFQNNTEKLDFLLTGLEPQLEETTQKKLKKEAIIMSPVLWRPGDIRALEELAKLVVSDPTISRRNKTLPSKTRKMLATAVSLSEKIDPEIKRETIGRLLVHS